jgi:hypothetical protein
MSTKPLAYRGSFDFPLTVEAGGPGATLEWDLQIWSEGKPVPGPKMKRLTVEDAGRESLTFTLRISGGKDAYEVSGDHRVETFLRRSMIGETLLEIPKDISSPWIVTVTAPGSFDLDGKRDVTVWGVLGNREPLDLPPGSPLEAWAAKADWAMLVRIRRVN